jgi:hypothetical protein
VAGAGVGGGTGDAIDGAQHSRGLGIAARLAGLRNIGRHRQVIDTGQHKSFNPCLTYYNTCCSFLVMQKTAPRPPSAAIDAVTATIRATAAIAEAISEVGQIPNGHLYAQCMGSMSFESYAAIIALLKRAGLVAESASVLRWVGPSVQS